MAATITATISSLILTLDDPGRDDLDSVTVWASTTSGFTPSNSNVVYKGKSLTITIANLIPLTTYYLRYAYISEIDPTDYVISSELSGIPNQIDGSLIATGAIRGKILAGNVFYDRGTTVTAYLATPATPITAATIAVNDTTDFPTSGAIVIVSNVNGEYRTARYTGKTSTSLTGVSGITAEVFVGEAVLPIFYGTSSVASYTAGATTIATDSFSFPASGGNAIAFSETINADAFTYTNGYITSTVLGITTYSPGMSGVSGLATISTPFYVAENPGFPTVTLTAFTDYSTLTLSAASSLFEASGGVGCLVKIGSPGFYEFQYRSVSGTSMKMGASSPVNVGVTGTYYVIPWQSNTLVGANRSVFMYDNKPSGLKVSYTSPDKSSLAHVVATTAKTSFGDVLVPIEAVSTESPSVYGDTTGSLYLPYACSVPTGTLSNYAASNSWLGSFGAMIPAYISEARMVFTADFGVMRYLQPQDTVHYFSPEIDANSDSVSFNDATNSYSFNADGGSGNAALIADSIDVAAGSASAPTLSTVADTNTGVFFPAADTLGFSTGGTERLRLRSDGAAAFGGSGAVNVNLNLARNLSGSTNVYGVASQGVVQSDAATNARYFYSAASTAANGGTAYTIAALSHYSASQGTFSADSTVSVQYGFVALGTLISATNNYSFYAANTSAILAGATSYGFYSAVSISSGGTTWGFYAAGTAPNYFGGYTRINVTDNTNPALKITQAGTADGLSVDGVGVFGAGNPAGQNMNGSGGTPRVQVQGIGSTYANSAFAAVNWGASIRGGGIYLATARGGTVGSYAAAVQDDYMGEIRFAGSDGTQMQQGATIGVLVDGTPAAGSMPGRISFQTSPSGSANPVERARVDSAGNVLVTGPGGLGYGTGSGGAVTQATSRTTGVTLNKTNGAITLVSAAGSTAWQSFTVTNSIVAATDTVIVNQKSGTDLYECHVTAVAAGSFRISYRTTAGTTTEQPVFNFSVIKAVAA